MPNRGKYAVFHALDPLFEIIQEGLTGLVDGEHFFETIADDAFFEFLYDFPGWPRTIRGRADLMDQFSGYGHQASLVGRARRASLAGSAHRSPAQRCHATQLHRARAAGAGLATVAIADPVRLRRRGHDQQPAVRHGASRARRCAWGEPTPRKQGDPRRADGRPLPRATLLRSERRQQAHRDRLAPVPEEPAGRAISLQGGGPPEAIL